MQQRPVPLSHPIHQSTLLNCLLTEYALDLIDRIMQVLIHVVLVAFGTDGRVVDTWGTCGKLGTRYDELSIFATNGA